MLRLARLTRRALLTAAITTVCIPALGLHAPCDGADLDVPTVAYPTLQAAVAEAAGNGDALNTIYIHDRVSTTGQVTLGPAFDASRALILCPAADAERATMESLNGSQPALILDGCHNVSIRDLDVLRNTTNAADLIRMDHAEDCTVERCRLGSIWSVPGAPGKNIVLISYPKDIVMRNNVLFSAYPGTFDKGIRAQQFNDDENSLFLYNNVVADYKIYGIHIEDGAGVPGALVLLRNNVVANHPAAPAEPHAYRSDVDAPITIVTSHNVALATAGFEQQLGFACRDIAGTAGGGAFLRYNRDLVNPIFVAHQWVTIPAWDPNPDFFMLEPAGNPMHDGAGDYGANVADGAPHARDLAVTDDIQKNARPSGTTAHTDRGVDQLEVAALAAGPGPHWYPLTGAQPGTPPTITLLPTSDPRQTDLEIEVHGFYYWNVTQAGQSFVRVSLRADSDLGPLEPRPSSYEPGPLGSSEALGRPELPILAHLLGGLCGIQVGPPEVQVLSEIAIPGPLVYPLQPGADDHPGDPPPAFRWDQAWYQQTVRPYPPVRAASEDSVGRSSGMTLLRAETHAVRQVPVSRMSNGAPSLLVARHLRVMVPHGDCTAPEIRPVSRRIARKYERMLANYGMIGGYRPVLVDTWAGDYLIVTLPEHVEEIDPLVLQKRRRGYATTVVTTDVTGRTCADIKDYVAGWWNDGDPGRDHYVLLVGDADDLPATEDLPTCSDENNNASDKIYACIDGVGADGRADPYPEVLIGRLPADTEADCSDMVEKILTYEGGYPMGASWLGDVLLTSHMEDYPEEYTANQNEVAAAVYSTAPAFTVLHGGEGATDNQVIAEIEAGKGVVCYRGHGSYTSWGGWNGGSFGSTDIALIDNGTMTPVVFSFACFNGALDSSDVSSGCAGELWLETTERGVACYAASGGSSTSANHVMNKEMFKAIYDDDIVILGDAIAAEEAETIRITPERGEKNAWQYVLFGDPELKVLREDVPPPFIAVSAGNVPVGPGTIVVQVYSGGGGGSAAPGASGSGGTPVPLAIVTAYKDGEFVASRYTDANGEAQLTILPTSPGTIEITVTTEFDSYAEARDTVLVTSTTGVAEPRRPGAALALEPAWPNPARSLSSISYALPRDGRTRVEIYDVRGCRVATLVDGNQDAGRHVVGWDGRGIGGDRLGAGVYFARLEFEGESRSTRLARIE